MTKKEVKPVIDIYKKFRLSREESQTQLETESIRSHILSISNIKKPINIPIGDFTIDSDYEKNVLPNFKLPPSFVRHTKKIGDERDIAADYVMEDDDQAWIYSNPRLSADKDSLKYLTVPNFERIIDILEKHTGFAAEPIPQSHADKLVTEKLSWPNSVTAKILPEIYQFWLSKRERLQKPLLRRFWPQISSSDTNPHHVFRARDKERYRLRKQQKKNDIESFRRMRQMRQEFQKARDLLLLVLEREKLKEAELDVRMRIFEHNLRLVDGETAIHYPRSANGDSIESKVVAESDQGQDISKSSSGQASIGDELIAQGPSLETAPSNYPTIPYVLEDAVKEILKRKSQAELIAEAAAAAEKANKEQAEKEAKSKAMSSATDKKFTLVLSKTKIHGNAPTATGGYDNLAVESMNASVSGDASKSKADTKKDKKGGDRKSRKKPTSFGEVNASGEFSGEPNSKQASLKLLSEKRMEKNSLSSAIMKSSLPVLGGAESLTDHSMTVTDMSKVYPQLPGPKHLCRPNWPCFMATLATREKMDIPFNMSEYLEELELKNRFDLKPVLNEFAPRTYANRPVRCYSDPALLKRKACAVEGSNVVTTSGGQNGSGASKNDESDGTACVTGFASANITSSSNEDGQEADYPLKYRCRGRIGRGGRLVIDRFPVYENEMHESHSTKYIYPTSLPVPKRRHTAVGTEFFPFPQANVGGAGLEGPNQNSSTPAVMEKDETKKAASMNTLSRVRQKPNYQHRLPVAVPLSRGPLPSAFITRQNEIFNCSDSEDERVEIQRPKSTVPLSDVTNASAPPANSSGLNANNKNDKVVNDQPIIKYILHI